MAQKKKHQHLKVILSIGGGGQGSACFSSISSDESKRQLFAYSVKVMVKLYGFDGVDGTKAF